MSIWNDMGMVYALLGAAVAVFLAGAGFRFRLPGGNRHRRKIHEPDGARLAPVRAR